MKKLDEIQTIKRNETIGRELIKKLCEHQGWGYSEPMDLMLSYDLFIERNGERCMCEIKKRDEKYEWVAKRDGAVFEEMKYQGLIQEARKENPDKILYINIFGNTCYIFEINDELLKKSDKVLQEMNKQTFRSTENKIPKVVYHLPIKYAEKYEITE